MSLAVNAFLVLFFFIEQDYNNDCHRNHYESHSAFGFLI